MINAELFLRDSFIKAAGAFRNHRLLSFRKRACLVSETFDRRIVTVRRDKRCERLHKVPRRAVYPRLVTGVNVLAGTATPPLAAGDEFKLHHSFASQADGHIAVEPLRS